MSLNGPKSNVVLLSISGRTPGNILCTACLASISFLALESLTVKSSREGDKTKRTFPKLDLAEQPFPTLPGRLS